MSPTKVCNQHDYLHLQFPNNCCLCRAEQEIKELKERLDRMEESKQNIKEQSKEAK